MLDNISNYIYSVYELKSVSLAAKKLYVSQPALSSAIKREEERLGFKIFNRKTLPLTLTPEGKFYIEAIEKVRQIESSSMEKIQSIQQANIGTLRIATSTHLSYYIIPKILREFQKKYPKVDIQIIITDTGNLFDMLQNETVDVIFTFEKNTSDEYKTSVLMEEHFIVASPRALVPSELLKYAVSYEEVLCRTYSEDKLVSDLSMFHDLEFIYSPPKSNIQKKRRILFGKDDLHPYITSNASSQQFNFNLMRAGFGALLTTDANLATMRQDDSCCLFVLGGENAKQDFSVVSNVNNSLIADNFISLAQSIFAEKKSLNELVRL